jgi:hypothetical protein
MTNKIIIDNEEYKKMIQEIEAFNELKKKRSFNSMKYNKKYAELTEEEKEKRKSTSLKYYYKMMTSDEERQKRRDVARQYYQNKIKTDPDKYNRIKERQKIKYETTKHEKKESPREFVNLEIAAY